MIRLTFWFDFLPHGRGARRGALSTLSAHIPNDFEYEKLIYNVFVVGALWHVRCGRSLHYCIFIFAKERESERQRTHFSLMPTQCSCWHTIYSTNKRQICLSRIIIFWEFASHKAHQSHLFAELRSQKRNRFVAIGNQYIFRSSEISSNRFISFARHSTQLKMSSKSGFVETVIRLNGIKLAIFTFVWRH